MIPAKHTNLCRALKLMYLILVYTQALYAMLPQLQSLEVNFPLWLKKHSSAP